MQRLHARAVRTLTSLAVGSTLVLSGCDPNVRSTVLGGVESASTGLVAAFISAFFQSLEAKEEIPATVMLFDETPLPFA